ncbi:MAG: hypothetical protein LBD08_04480 [Treponema sp.]|jgi:hypothetical protein|nr:hypothetical protein [Treponema sp.]
MFTILTLAILDFSSEFQENNRHDWLADAERGITVSRAGLQRGKPLPGNTAA